MSSPETYIQSLPESNFPDMFQTLKDLRKFSKRTIIVLDDDPTGCQTVSDAPVLFQWDRDILLEFLEKEENLIFLMTNSRSMTEAQAVNLYKGINDLLRELCGSKGKNISIVSRSDSTLRGHYPAEPYALHSFFPEIPVHVLIPAFFQGGRYTLDDVHYVKSETEYLPAANTPFARDKVFGFRHSNIKDYVEEKTMGKVTAQMVFSFDIESLRAKGPVYVAEKLQSAMPGSVCFVNAFTQNDLDIFALGAHMAEGNGKSILYRTAASFLNSFAAIPEKDLLRGEDLSSNDKNGGVIIVGSYVPKTNAQIETLMKETDIFSLEVNVEDLLSEMSSRHIEKLIAEASTFMASGRNVLIYTSRKLVHAGDEKANLDIGTRVSAGLVSIGKSLSRQASFIVAKGGITSHDVAAKGIGIKKARVIGQALPGVPVLVPDDNKDFKYIIFPGNVGEEKSLVELYNKLTVKK